MVASVDSAESGPSEGTLDPAEIDFGGPVDFEGGKHDLALTTLSGPETSRGGVGVHDVRRQCRCTSLSVAVSVASLS